MSSSPHRFNRKKDRCGLGVLADSAARSEWPAADADWL